MCVFVDFGDHAWQQLAVDGEWTKETAGGGNIAGRLAWTKNPQYVVQIGEKTDVCITMSQETKDEGIGFYVVKHPGVGKLSSLRKLIHYDDEFTKTTKFLRSYVVGVAHLQLEPKQAYVIIPCTFEAGVVGKFRLSIFARSTTASVKLLPLVAKWQCRTKLKSRWAAPLAGGGPSHAGFCQNPQFLLTFDKVDTDKLDSIAGVVQLLQQPEAKSIGFIVFRSPHARGEAKPLTALPTKEGEVVCKPDGYVQVLSVAEVLNIDAADANAHSFIIVATTFKPDEHKAFQINVWSDVEHKLVAINKVADAAAADDADDDAAPAAAATKSKKSKTSAAAAADDDDEVVDVDAVASKHKPKEKGKPALSPEQLDDLEDDEHGEVSFFCLKAACVLQWFQCLRMEILFF